MKRLFAVDPWKIIEEELHKDDFRLAESMTSLGNGHMGLRGNFEETYSGDSHKGTYIAGVWYPDKTRVGWWKNGYPDYFGKVINAIDFIGIRVLIDGDEIDLYTAEVKDYRRELDMKTGILTRSFTIVRDGKETKVDVLRYLSIAQRQLGVINYQVTPLNHDGKVTFIPYLEGDVRNEDSNYDEDFWKAVTRFAEPNKAHLVMETNENPFGTEIFRISANMGLVAEGDVTEVTPFMNVEYVDNTIVMNTTAGKPVSLTKYIAVTTNRDYDSEHLVEKGEDILNQAMQAGFEACLTAHKKQWAERWDMADIQIDGDNEAQQGIRFNLFQLFSTYYGEDARLNIGPKGFTGEKYGGATYWDTEAYALPFYLATAKPEVARNLLIYRYNQLEGAYVNAKRQGLEGALYPMVTFTGVECHNEWEITFEEIHRNAAIAYAIYNYVNYTGDKEYLLKYGIDVLTGISRFWADRVHYQSRKDQYMIHGVTGPNEYENNVNNNWYTNRMAAWTLQYTLAVINELKESGHESRLAELYIYQEELNRWAEIKDKMYLPYDEELQVFVQHDTFLDKDLKNVSELSPQDRPLNQKWSWDRILRSCFIKQADVLQGIYFLNNEFTYEEKLRNFEFYEPMTVHESSLSPSVHAVLAAELGMEEKAYEMYNRTARLDLDNYNNDTEDGLHITSMTGSWLAIVQGFAGMKTFDGVLAFAPFIPAAWDRYAFNINYRDHQLTVKVDKETVQITQKGSALSLEVYGVKHDLVEDGILDVPLMKAKEESK